MSEQSGSNLGELLRERYEQAEAKWRNAIEAQAIARANLVDAEHEKRLASDAYAEFIGLSS